MQKIFRAPFLLPPTRQEEFQQGGPWVFSCVGIRYKASEKFSGGRIGQVSLSVEFGAFFAIGPEQRGTEGRNESKVKVPGSQNKLRA